IEAQAYAPDIVVYTGDFVSYESTQQFEQLTTILKKAVTGKLGTIGVLGNHDYGENWAEPEVANRIVEICEANNIQILRNEEKNINGLNIIGFDDYWAIN